MVDEVGEAVVAKRRRHPSFVLLLPARILKRYNDGHGHTDRPRPRLLVAAHHTHLKSGGLFQRRSRGDLEKASLVDPLPSVANIFLVEVDVDDLPDGDAELHQPVHRCWCDIADVEDQGRLAFVGLPSEAIEGQRVRRLPRLPRGRRNVPERRWRRRDSPASGERGRGRDRSGDRPRPHKVWCAGARVRRRRHGEVHRPVPSR
mmetsp:Transcript_2614/g.7439  ORF Transcript_2614/g.7439 Transcript_2614/m.7439 type:complete len:203 (-) Transcript_2614:775-1383(-)